MEGREAKDRLYEQFARTAKAIAHPTRIELLELIAQGDVSVDTLAQRGATSVTNASAHLQILRRARLVETRREGTRVFYRLASEDVVQLISTLRDVSRARLAEVNDVVRDYFTARDVLEPITRDELPSGWRQGWLRLGSFFSKSCVFNRDWVRFVKKTIIIGIFNHRPQTP